MRVKCLAEEHNTMSPARARTRTARSGVERTNHEATAPPTRRTLGYNRYLTNLVFSVRTASYGSSFFPLRFMACALRSWAINRGGKNSVRNLRHGPRTRLVWDIKREAIGIGFWFGFALALL